VRKVRQHTGRPAHAHQGARPVLRDVLPALCAASGAKESRGVTVGVNSVSDEIPKSTRDLRPSERRFLSAMQRLGYGRFDSLRIQRGELVLEPAPATVRSIKFGNTTSNRPHESSGEFELKHETAQLFEFVRSIDAGEIQVLEVRGGLPFAMEIAE
jgi:hypothetical protein